MNGSHCPRLRGLLVLLGVRLPQPRKNEWVVMFFCFPRMSLPVWGGTGWLSDVSCSSCCFSALFFLCLTFSSSFVYQAKHLYFIGVYRRQCVIEHVSFFLSFFLSFFSLSIIRPISRLAEGFPLSSRATIPRSRPRVAKAFSFFFAVLITSSPPPCQALPLIYRYVGSRSLASLALVLVHAKKQAVDPFSLILSIFPTFNQSINQSTGFSSHVRSSHRKVMEPS